MCSLAAIADSSVSGTIRLDDPTGNRLPSAANFVAFIEGNDPASSAALAQIHTTASPPHISHKDQAFSPRVLVITTGTTVDFKNDDRIYHNAFSLSKSKPFDLGIYPEGTSKFVTFNEPGLVRVYCNMHPEMISNILVLGNQYFAVTSDNGRFHIGDLPNGNFTLRIWSEHAGELSRVLSVTGDQPLVEDFTAISRPQFGQHNNKFGKPYRDKY
jgi:plastocyanin